MDIGVDTAPVRGQCSAGRRSLLRVGPGMGGRRRRINTQKDQSPIPLSVFRSTQPLMSFLPPL